MSSEGGNWGSLPWSCRGKIDFLRGGVSPLRRRDRVPPCGAGSFSTWKRNQKTLWGGRNRQDRQSRSCLHAALPLEPPLRGTRTCEVEQNFRRAKQKLPLLRFHNCAWLCRADDSCSAIGGRPKGLPYPSRKDFLETRRGGAEGESAEGREKPPWGVPLPRAGPGPAPTAEGAASVSAVGAGPRPARQGFKYALVKL